MADTDDNDIYATLYPGLNPDGSTAPTPSADEQQLAGGALAPKYDDFFTTHLPHANRIAAEYGVDPTLPLGVAACESGYGTSDAALKKNNPAGMKTKKGIISYPSFDHAWQEWGETWGHRIRGVGNDKQAFVEALYDGDYDPGNTRWKKGVSDCIDGVRKRLPLWSGSQN